MAAALLMDRTSTTSRISRVTKAGRKLKYVLTVIQQPERARACGSGAKSSSDRRPVDPPPVVELKIYCEDGPTIEDITFGYEANFFLFVTLDAASPATRSRTHPSTAQTNPVLTGMPVSGMAYLDRPSEAGYFIFPDLSVRHEGHYVLCFNLYEECKNDCDRDTYQRRCSFEESSEAESSFDWRMEVKSLPFTVYSAKKFPGLTESTHLSRIVAEQGCRVRIRRDARMRRRDQKIDLHTNHQDYYCHPEDEEEYDEPARSCSFGGSTKSAPIPRPELGRSCSDITLQNRHRYSTAGHRSRLPSIDLQRPSGKSPSFPQLPLPRPIQPPAEPNTFSFAKIPSKYCFENRTYLSHAQILNPSRESQDYDRNPRRSSTCYTQPFNARNFGTPEYCQKSPPSHLSCSPSSPKTSPHSDTKAFSLTTKFLPPLNTNSLIERNTSARMSNKETPSYAHGYTSSIPLENCLPPLSKRPLETALPSIAAVTSARLFNGSRPLSPDSYYSKQQDELAHRGDLMSYRRASGAVQVRGPPVFS